LRPSGINPEQSHENRDQEAGHTHKKPRFCGIICLHPAGFRSQLWLPLAYRQVSSRQLAQKLTFVHAVFKRFAAIDEDDGNFVGELTAQLLIRIDINFMPGEPAPSVQFGQGLFDDLAKMTTLSRIHYYLAQDGHERSLAIVRGFCQHSSVKSR
jgi:hypothetical protein